MIPTVKEDKPNPIMSIFAPKSSDYDDNQTDADLNAMISKRMGLGYVQKLMITNAIKSRLADDVKKKQE